MIQIKNILCDLVDYAYRDNPKLEQYKHFYIEVSNNFMSFNRKSYICAGQGSYDIKDYLKDNGFFFDKKLKAWKKEGNSKDLTVYRREYPNVQWSII